MYNNYNGTGDCNTQVFTSNKTTPINNNLGVPINLNNASAVTIGTSMGGDLLTVDSTHHDDCINIPNFEGWKELDNHVETHEFISKDYKFYRKLLGNYHFDLFDKIVIDNTLFIIIDKYFEIGSDNYIYTITGSRNVVNNRFNGNKCKIERVNYDENYYYLSKRIRDLIDIGHIMHVDLNTLIFNNIQDRTYYFLEFKDKKSAIKKIECFDSIKLLSYPTNSDKDRIEKIREKQKEDNLLVISFDFDNDGTENLLDKKKILASKLHWQFCNNNYCTWNDELMDNNIWERNDTEHGLWLNKVEMLYSKNIKLKDIENIFDILNI